MSISGFPALPSVVWPNTIAPLRFYCQKVLPAVYDDSLSYYELLCKIAHYIEEILKNLDTINEDIQAIYDWMQAVQEWCEQLATYEDRMQRLEDMMQALAQNALIYDVTMGLYRPSMAANRRMWQAANIWGMKVSDFAEFTVAQTVTRGMTVRNVAVLGRQLFTGDGYDSEGIPIQAGYSTPCFNPDDYIKRSELTKIDSDNLQEHIIYGVLEKDTVSKLIEPTPYARPFTSHDLANTWVLFDDHVVTDFDNECDGG